MAAGADGADTGQTLTLSEDNEWTGAFRGVSRYRDHGTRIAYTVSEDVVADYTTAITGDAASGFIITNSHEPGKTQVGVHKV